MIRVATGAVETCIYCGGDGKNPHGNTCEFCDGHGEVDVFADDYADDYDCDTEGE